MSDQDWEKAAERAFCDASNRLSARASTRTDFGWWVNGAEWGARNENKLLAAQAAEIARLRRLVYEAWVDGATVGQNYGLSAGHPLGTLEEEPQWEDSTIKQDLEIEDWKLSVKTGDEIIARQAAEIERLREAARYVKCVVPYVIATLWKPGACHPEGTNEEWGTVHKGRSSSSIRQLEQLLDEARAALGGGGDS